MLAAAIVSGACLAPGKMCMQTLLGLIRVLQPHQAIDLRECSYRELGMKRAAALTRNAHLLWIYEGCSGLEGLARFLPAAVARGRRAGALPFSTTFSTAGGTPEPCRQYTGTEQPHAPAYEEQLLLLQGCINNSGAGHPAAR